MALLKHIVLLGAGAVGVLPAEKLLKLPDIRFTAAADMPRVIRYRRDGIFLNRKKLDFTFAAPEEMGDLPPADLIIAATKTVALAEALDNVVPVVGEKTIFLPLLNGITAHEVIQARFPSNPVLRGYFLGHASVREKNFITHDGVGTFYCGGEAEFLTPVYELFKRAGISVEIPENMLAATWKKFVLNVGINQTQAMFSADYGMVQRDEKLLTYCRKLMEEAVAVANAEGVTETENMISAAMEVILSMPGNVKTSMLQDMLARHKTEVDAFAGTICTKAEKYGIPTPLNAEVLAAISSREAAYPAETERIEP